jgi:hypothetical protein
MYPIGSMVLLYMVTFTTNIPQMLAYIPYMDPMGMALECMLARSDTTIFMNELESCGCKRTRFCSESVWPPQFLPRTAEIHFRHHKNCREAFFFSPWSKSLRLRTSESDPGPPKRLKLWGFCAPFRPRHVDRTHYAGAGGGSSWFQNFQPVPHPGLPHG